MRIANADQTFTDQPLFDKPAKLTHSNPLLNPRTGTTNRSQLCRRRHRPLIEMARSSFQSDRLPYCASAACHNPHRNPMKYPKQQDFLGFVSDSD
jgi:hypothetical protein